MAGCVACISDRAIGRARRRTRLLCLCGLLVALAGCAGPPTQFYRLDERPPPLATAPIPLAVPVRLDSVTLPAELDRAPIVRRAGAERLDVAETARWAGPLDTLVRQTLAADLALRLPAGALLGSDDAAPSTPYRAIEITVERFEGDIDGPVTLRVFWILRGAAAAPVLMRREERIQVPATAGIDGAVAAMSSALGILADRIAAVLQ